MRVNIHHKITLILTITIAVILSGIYLYLNTNLKQYTYQRIQSDLTKQSALTKLHLEQVFTQSRSQAHIDKVADQIGANLNVRVTIIGVDGMVLGDSDLDMVELESVENHLFRPEIQSSIKNNIGESHRFSTTLHIDMLYMARFFKGESGQGFVRLAIPLSEIEVISNNLKKMLLISLMFAFLFTIIIGSTAFFFVSKPIKEISSIAKEIALGNYTKRVAITTNDEIGELAKSINYMSEQINIRIEEVISNKSRFEAVLLSLYEGTMVVDKSNTIILMNRALRELFHIDQDPSGQKPLELIRNIDIQEIIDRVLKTKQPVASQELSILVPQEYTMQVYAAPVLRGEEMDGVVLVFHDITELKRLENIRRDFVANVSHEIRTPLTSVKGYVETLLDGAINDKENAIDFLKIIGSDANRLVQLVDDLLDLSKIESDKLNLEILPHSIESIIDRVIFGLKTQAGKKNIVFKKDVPADIPKINMDDTSIAQVLLNLIENAVKYNNENGIITISVHDEDGQIRVDVSDTGIGIPQEDLPRIFERFYRVDKARSRQLGGTGLGLAIVKHIIQSHKGEVLVQSRLGQGSTFSFTLPKG